MKIKIMALSLIIVISMAAGTQTSKISHVNARAMLVQMPVAKFQAMSDNGSGGLKPLDAMEVIGCLFADNDVVLTTYSQLQITVDDRNASSENKINKRMRLPIRKSVSGSNIDPYPIIEYTWCENYNYFKMTMIGRESKLSGDMALSCNCLFEYKWSQIIPFGQLEEVACWQNIEQIKSDNLSESNFSCNANVLLKVGQTSVIGSQKIGDNYYILLVNVSDK